MSYLERNSQFVSELGNIRLQRGKVRGEGTFAVFTSAGSYTSKTEGEVFIGLKETKASYSRSEAIRERFVHELAIMSVIATNMPHLLPELPLFYGLVTDENGVPMAIVTEDLSKDGKNRVNKTNLSPRGLKDIFVEDTIDEEFLLDAAFIVQEKREYVEFPEGELPPIGATLRKTERRLGIFIL